MTQPIQFLDKAPEIRPIPGFVGYGVSKDGRIWTKRSNSGRLRPEWELLQGSINEDGYQKVALYANRKPKQKLGHRVIWETWVGPIPSDREINHKDGVKTNNNLSNLELVTDQENSIHAHQMGLQEPLKGEDNGSHKLTENEIHLAAEMRRNNATYAEIGKALGVRAGTAMKILKGERWKHIDTGKIPAINLHIKGETHWNAKITEEQAKQILQMRREGHDPQAIADAFLVGKKLVLRLLRGETWRHLERDNKCT